MVRSWKVPNRAVEEVAEVLELKVAYQAEDGRQRSKEFSVNESIFNQHCNASSITNPQIAVKYAKSNPALARLVGQPDNSGVMMIFGMILLGLGVGGISLLRLVLHTLATGHQLQ